MSTLCDRVERAGVRPQDFRLHLFNMLAFDNDQEIFRVKHMLNMAETINNMFCILSDECASFLNCEIFLSILKYYHISIDCEELDYLHHLKAYVQNHTISEFISINPKLKNHTRLKHFVIKFNIKLTSKVSKLLDIQERVADILGILPHNLLIVGIEEGCVIITFQIPPQLADIIFTSKKKFTSKEVQQFQALSALWLECNHFKFEFLIRGKIRS